MNLKNGLLAGAFAILAVVAVIGWTHGRTGSAASQPANYAQPGYAQPATEYPAANPSYVSPPSPAAYDNGVDNGVAYQPGVYYPDAQYVQSIHRPVVVRPVEAPPPPPEYVDQTRPRDHREYREIHHRRSTGKSVAIVAGSAGVGAAIGALAGGGKGAGIGALAGGAGGFVYDRLTHNR